MEIWRSVIFSLALSAAGQFDQGKDECSCGDESGVNKRPAWLTSSPRVIFLRHTLCFALLAESLVQVFWFLPPTPCNVFASAHRFFDSTNSVPRVDRFEESRRKLSRDSVIFPTFNRFRERWENRGGIDCSTEWEEWIERIDRTELVKYASSRGIDFSTMLKNSGKNQRRN